MQFLKSRRFAYQLFVPVVLAALALAGLSATAFAQQTLGGITGTVTDPQGSAIPGATITAISDDTKLSRSATSNAQGSYQLNDLPIGKYTVTVTMQGFSATKFPGIVVQADRTDTLPAQLAVGGASDSVTVDFNPLLNAVDTTNGYVLDKDQIQSIPLPTGSFTGVAILSPGVNAELPSGTGANDGLGNQPIWANGQRDTSNSFSLNGVDSSNLFNGKSTSAVTSARVINSTGSSGGSAGGIIVSAASVYLSIGNAIPTPAPETIAEVKVNASMYDASQGSTSGAHIDLSTASGTNDYHGTVYGHRGTNWINAAPFFFKNDGDIPENLKNPELHRYVLGGTVGGPIIKNKLFAFFAYQHLQVSDSAIGYSFLDVPVGLSDSTRDAGGFAGIVNAQYDTAIGTPGGGAIDNTALALFNSPALPGEPGKWLIPNDTGSSLLSATHPFNAFLPGTGRFKADTAVANIDYNATSKDTLSLKYFYQHDPTLAPYAYSSVPGFTEHLDSGAQVFSIINTYLVKSNLSTTESLGFLREKIYADNEQPFGPGAIPGGSIGTASINEFGSNYFPGVSIYNVLGDAAYNAGVSTGVLNIGPNAEGQASNVGVFQNRLQPAGNGIWTIGKHTISFGTSYSYTQLNTIDKRTNTGSVATDDLSAFAQGYVTPGSSSTGFYVSSFLQGDASRYYRANQIGSYVQDKFQVIPTLSLTAGLRYDWDGGLSEKYGRLFNFDPSLYNYNAGSDTIVNPGFIIAGNNVNGTPGVSKTTLTGRQWGIAPRIGAAWQPEMFHNKVVVRSGFGMYYDRGELFTYFSPGYAIGTVTGGPFGVNQQLPFVTASTCTVGSLYSYYIPTCGGAGGSNPPVNAPDDADGDLANPYGLVLNNPVSSNPKASDLSKYLPNLAQIGNGGQPISLGVYDRANKLPYTYNYTLDVQWQPRNDLVFELGYVGNLGRHQVIPVPFNQPGIANPSAPIHGENYSYGYQVQGPVGCAATFSCAPIALPDGTTYRYDYEGGNVDHRVPYVGYAAESISYKAAGVDAYNALTAHLEKRMSKNIQFAASYTYSHALDEQSGLGLFYNGNNPLDLRDGYASADFDRTHVINFNYVFRMPDLIHEKNIASDFANGWSLVGLTVLQSGQPYSVIDYTGAIGSVYYSTSNGITNPIVPLNYGACTAKSAVTGKSGAFGDYALNANCFTIPLLTPGPGGSFNGAIPSTDPYETGFTTGQRNIFRQAFQKRADASLVKMTKFSDRYSLKYTFDVYNLTNTSSFDVPGNEVSQNENYNAVPQQGTPVSPGTCSAAGVGSVSGSFYNCPFGLGVVSHTIGSPRQVQMSLQFLF
ncbi:TonB-dependent receptor [Granulicella sp. 5B5]|uniref:carboxypeptidase regulatory-like domain-containing protein n=1 Tax=Granulicella sp. 5B5 TaxID=1617967 RepID=UPI002107D119|nr:TonB-dependent receptor [Granulicella sp. 5B5]